MDQDLTIFYLVPLKYNKFAIDIVADPANRNRRCLDPSIAQVPCLRVGLDQQHKSPPYLAQFGRSQNNDVILDKTFSRRDQCYFDFNTNTGELLLHDISAKGDTQLFEQNEKGEPTNAQIWKSPRQCAVPLQRVWIFQIGRAFFCLNPKKTLGGQSEEFFMKEKLEFARQFDPDQTLEVTTQCLSDLVLRNQGATAAHNCHNTRLKTSLEPGENESIRYTKLGPLGSGGQGVVQKVVDMHNGNHYACKILIVREIPQQGIHSEKDFRERVEREVNFVKQVDHHEHIVPYLFTQGFKIGANIELFMPIYDGSLAQLMKQQENKTLPKRQAIANRMLPQILSALECLHSFEPSIIHRDIKPGNILYQGHGGDKFLLTDFGIAKNEGTSSSIAGTRRYLAPEFRNSEQTSKADIYALGITYLTCMAKLLPETKRNWRRMAQETLARRAPPLAAMLADVADQRPTAQQLRKDFLSHISSLNEQSNATSLSLEVSPSVTQVNGTMRVYSSQLTPMDWAPKSPGPFQARSVAVDEDRRDVEYGDDSDHRSKRPRLA